MALLRVVCIPSTRTSHLSTQHQSHHLTSFSFSHSVSLCQRSSSLTLIRTAQQISDFTVKSTSQQQVLDTSEGATTATEEEEEEEEEFSQTRLLAQNVPWTSTPEDIRSLFERHGRVLQVELSMFNKTRNRGLAFVEMGSPEEALAALKNLESYEFEGRILKLSYARPKKKKTPPPVPRPKPVTFNLFVANLHYEARSKDLKEFFDSGSVSDGIVSAEVIFHDNPRRSSGFGFVSFKSKKQADAALSEFQGKDFMGRPIRVARSRRFVKPQVEESARSEDTSSELSVNGSELSMNGEESDKAD